MTDDLRRVVADVEQEMRKVGAQGPAGAAELRQWADRLRAALKAKKKAACLPPDDHYYDVTPSESSYDD